MLTVILLFRLLSPGDIADPAAVDEPSPTQADEPMRYHGIEALLAKFEAEWDSRPN